MIVTVPLSPNPVPAALPVTLTLPICSTLYRATVSPTAVTRATEIAPVSDTVATPVTSTVAGAVIANDIASSVAPSRSATPLPSVSTSTVLRFKVKAAAPLMTIGTELIRTSVWLTPPKMPLPMPVSVPLTFS